MRRRTALALVFVVVFFFGIPALVAGLLSVRIGEPYQNYEGREQFVEVPMGAGTAEIGRRLVDAGVVGDRLTFRFAVLWAARGRTLKAGEYRFDKPLAATAVVDRLARGDVYVRRITFPEGLTILEMARIYQTRGLGQESDFRAAAARAELIRDLDPAARDLEGYLYPETYALPRGTPAATLVATMVERFKASYDESLRARAQAAGLTTREVVTLASLVEKETAKGEERPLVAAVYRNRLKIGMGMQADPTVVYALQKAGRYDGNIRRDDLAFDSPYNTYRYAGLPPGPIAAPSRSSLAAVVAPANAPYLYFVSRNDGSHAFAATLPEHNRNVQKFQVEFFRRQRSEQRAAGGTAAGAAARQRR